MIAIIDYGVGNLFSLVCSLNAIGVEAVVTSDEKVIRSADQVILPGVGAFEEAAEKLRRGGFDKLLTELKESKPILGICLGMQLLFDLSYENGAFKGLGIIPGKVVPMQGVVGNNKVPQIGWNRLDFTNECPIFRYISDGDFVYFVHSYYAETPSEFITATTEYGASITAAVRRGNVYGCQFHPEKSGDVGLKILKAFSEIK